MQGIKPRKLKMSEILNNIFYDTDLQTGGCQSKEKILEKKGYPVKQP